MAVDCLTIDVFRLALVGLENNVRLRITEGVFKRGVLFVKKVFREELTRGDDADELVAGFGRRRDMVGEKVGVFVVADNDRAKSSLVAAEEVVTESTEKCPVQSQEEETQQE